MYDFRQILKRLHAAEKPVILLEGYRTVPKEDVAALTELARTLAVLMPNARFRTGNAPGSDTFFAEGVAFVDPSHLEYVVPYEGHPKKQRQPGVPVFLLDSLSPDHEAEIAERTIAASPEKRGSLKTATKCRLSGKRPFIF